MEQEDTLQTIKRESEGNLSLMLGMRLFDTYGESLKDLTQEIILNELEKLDSVGKSRLLHYCYDLSATRFTQI